ncbi:unnamed protein product [Gongylonema pulchrum]|uniref:Uncharacterized protein n=1 Tax=Gongylonema pulchrum TaxID=637853 RepID=A0A183DE56_9BILA|nr:unnamed protein product [Gongylonema pulchrum]
MRSKRVPTAINGRSGIELSKLMEHQFTKKSKMILGQVQQRQKQEEDEQMESSVAQLTDKDPFNLSNDDYYKPKNVERYSLFFCA